MACNKKGLPVWAKCYILWLPPANKPSNVFSSLSPASAVPLAPTGAPAATGEADAQAGTAWAEPRASRRRTSQEKESPCSLGREKAAQTMTPMTPSPAQSAGPHCTAGQSPWTTAAPWTCLSCFSCPPCATHSVSAPWPFCLPSTKTATARWFTSPVSSSCVSMDTRRMLWTMRMTWRM